MTTLRRRMVLTTMLASSITLAIGGIVIYLAARFALIAEFDAALWARVHAIANDVEFDDELHRLEYHAPVEPEKLTAIQVDDAQHQPVGGNGDPQWVDRAAGEGLTQHRVDEVTIRQIILVTPALIEDAPPGAKSPPLIRVCIARSTAEVEARLRGLVHLLLATGMCIGAILSVLMALAARTTLRPLDRLAQDLARLRPGNPDDRIAATTVPSELIPMVTRLNELLERVEHSMASERRFNAALAHELRTPVAGLQTILDVHLSGQRPVEEYREALRSCAKVCTQIRALIQGLLLLAQADAGLLANARDDVLLMELLEQEWIQVRERADQKGMTVKWAVPRQLSLVSDRTLLALVIRNLFDNAVSHGQSQGEIHLAAQQSRDRLRLVVSNNGCTLAQEQVPLVFDRLWRGDAARTGSGTHCGLGLTLCREVLRVLGGSIVVTVDRGWFEAAIDLPIGAVAAV